MVVNPLEVAGELMKPVLLDGWKLIEEAAMFEDCLEAVASGLDARLEGCLSVNGRLLKGGESEALPEGQRVLLQDLIQ